jgi:hypothetical protein
VPRSSKNSKSSRPATPSAPQHSHFSIDDPLAACPVLRWRRTGRASVFVRVSSFPSVAEFNGLPAFSKTVGARARTPLTRGGTEPEPSQAYQRAMASVNDFPPRNESPAPRPGPPNQGRRGPEAPLRETRSSNLAQPHCNWPFGDRNRPLGRNC